MPFMYYGSLTCCYCFIYNAVLLSAVKFASLPDSVSSSSVKCLRLKISMPASSACCLIYWASLNLLLFDTGQMEQGGGLYPCIRREYRSPGGLGADLFVGFSVNLHKHKLGQTLPITHTINNLLLHLECQRYRGSLPLNTIHYLLWAMPSVRLFCSLFLFLSRCFSTCCGVISATCL